MAGVVDDDELFLDRFARKEIVVFAGEPVRLAAEVSEQRPVVADQSMCRGGGYPIFTLEGQELIRYRAVSPAPPWTLLECERGALTDARASEQAAT